MGKKQANTQLSTSAVSDLIEKKWHNREKCSKWHNREKDNKDIKFRLKGSLEWLLGEKMQSPEGKAV